MKQLTYHHILACLLACLCLLSGLLLPVVVKADVAAQVASRRWRVASARFTRLLGRHSKSLLLPFIGRCRWVSGVSRAFGVGDTACCVA